MLETLVKDFGDVRKIVEFNKDKEDVLMVVLKKQGTKIQIHKSAKSFIYVDEKLLQFKMKKSLEKIIHAALPGDKLMVLDGMLMLNQIQLSDCIYFIIKLF